MKMKNWGVEWRTYTDRETGAKVTQLCDYFANHCHVYFTNPSLFDNDTKLVMFGERENKANLFTVDLLSGEILQLTDYERIPPPHECNFQNIGVSSIRSEAYCWYKNKLMAIELHTGKERELYTMPQGYRRGNTNVTSDGKFVLGHCIKDLSKEMELDTGHGYVGFDEHWERNPHCFIYKAPVDGGKTEIIHEENLWLGHINASPVHPNLVSFCHEGPWHKVDHRIWVLDHVSGEIWKVRERKVPNERIGHEYWYADGETIGYHGEVPTSGEKFFGRAKYDNSNPHETSFPFFTGHIHSNDEEYVVGDGYGSTKHVRIWRYNRAADKYEGPRAVCIHRSSLNSQIVHVHPRFTPDGKKIIFTSDQSGYGSPYIVEVPPFDSLPVISDSDGKSRV